MGFIWAITVKIFFRLFSLYQIFNRKPDLPTMIMNNVKNNLITINFIYLINCKPVVIADAQD